MQKCESAKCEGSVKVRKLELAPQLSRCESDNWNEEAAHCADLATLRKCESAKARKRESAKVRKCESGTLEICAQTRKVRKRESAKVRKCESAKAESP